MEHSTNISAPEASTDERASPFHSETEVAEIHSDWPEFATREEAMAFWQGIRRGIREAGRDLTHPHLPAGFALSLARDGEAPSLTSDKPLDLWPHNPDDEHHRGYTSHGPALVDPRADRHDGFTVEKEQLFLRTLADTGIVADACRATGVTRQAAYARRRSAAGRAFALAWDAALLIARGAVVDDVFSRARHGVIERVYRNGELVAERHKYDNRLTLALLTRLDRLAEGQGANAPVVQAVAQEFDQFLGLLPQGLGAAEDFIAARVPDPPRHGEGNRPRTRSGGGGGAGTAPITTERTLLARLRSYEDHGAGLPREIGTDDLDSADMTSWTDDQFARAKASGFLRSLPESAWPEAARDASADTSDGMCKIRQLYLLHHPGGPPAPEPEDDFGGCDVWEDAVEGWVTDFPPPPGFDGYEEGEPGTDDYRRALTPEESAVVAEDEAIDSEEHAAYLAELESARRRYFGLDEGGSEADSANAS